ncbi:MAG: hypothetical protein AB7D51_10155 [Desulfovibrionaceae bacterium]
MKQSHPGIIWISGEHTPLKATLVAQVREQCRARSIAALIIGDGQVRECPDDDACLNAEERVHRSLCRLVRTLAGQGSAVIVDSGPLPPDSLRWNREHLKGYYEVCLGEEARPENIRPDLRVYAPLDTVPLRALASDIAEEVFGLGRPLPGSARSGLPSAGALAARAV